MEEFSLFVELKAAGWLSLVAGRSSDLHKLNKHAIELSLAVRSTAEECSLAVGDFVGYETVKSASRINRAVVISVDYGERESATSKQSSVSGYFILMLSLENPA